ncbi:hypothetical protein [Streptomyces sp. NPDC046197]|uniref:hypothetical protein n=1 Tax=Streptomyces sp. NPDC046197 TaxID=3154337 RepID=UPI003407B160
MARIKQETFAASMADRRVTTVFARWSACMATRGFRVSDPLHPADKLPSLTEPVPSRAEIDQAEADVVCKQRTDLVGVWFAVESAYQRTAMGRNAAALTSVAAARNREAADIGRLVSRYGTGP